MIPKLLSRKNSVLADSLRLTRSHYENFPVASWFLPRHLKEPISLIYLFARTADDFADEGDFTVEERLTRLASYRMQLDTIRLGQEPSQPLFVELAKVIQDYDLNIECFYDLLKAFTQDVTTNQYQTLGDLIEYCRHSANPVGRLLLKLYRAETPRHIGLADSLCTALQLINFLQDLSVDIQKNRLYIPLDDLQLFHLHRDDILQAKTASTWPLLVDFEVARARKLLAASAPLGLALKGRIGFELRMVIAGGERMLKKIYTLKGNIIHERPKLQFNDWMYMFYRAIRKK
jgi:squalene synthase HpnC